MADKLTITWLGHSCFKVEAEDYSVIFDPYSDGKVPGLKPLRAEADQVLCSHEHGDHNFREGVTLRNRGVDSPFKLRTIDTYHDGEEGRLRGANRIHILDDGTFCIAHMGDLGCELTGEQLEQLRGLDVMMIPVGGYYTIDAAQAHQLVSQVKPRIAIPMHYRGADFGYEVCAPVSEYLDLCRDVVCYQNILEVTRELPEQTAVMKF